MPTKESSLIKEIICIGKKLHALRLVTARAGNLSCRLSKEIILITKTGVCLGDLRHSDIIRVDLNKNIDVRKSKASSEFPLHSLIYKNFSHKVVIHCHPPMANAYFAIYSNLKALTFETGYYLGKPPVIKQKTLTVTKPKPVIEALKKNHLVILKNHGVVAVGETFQDAFFLIEALESAVKTAAVARLFNKKKFDSLDLKFKENLALK